MAGFYSALFLSSVVKPSSRVAPRWQVILPNPIDLAALSEYLVWAMMRKLLLPALLAASVALAAFVATDGLHAQAASPAPQGAPAAAGKPAYLNPALPVAERVNDLVSRMTLDEKVRQMQHTAPAIPRLGVPSYDWWNEALHGVARSGYATVFPQAIGMAATWDSDLVHREGRLIATEARAKYNQAMREDNHSIYFGLTFW